MGTISDYLENELLDHVFNASFTSPTDLYLALCDADPTDAGTGDSISEPAGGNYARVAIAFDVAASRKTEQTSLVTFPQASASWGTITHWAVCDAPTSGNMLAYGSLATSKVVNSGNTPTVAVAETDVEFVAGAVSTYLANELLDHAFGQGGRDYAQPDTFIALTTDSISDTDQGVDLTEPDPATSYARIQVNPNGGASPVWNTAASGAIDNANSIIMYPSGEWGTINYMAVCDAVVSGEVLFYKDITNETPGSGDTVQFISGELDVSMD